MSTLPAKSVRSPALFSGGLFAGLTRRDWSAIRAALWAAHCSESNSRRGLNRFLGDNELIIAASVRRDRLILRVLKKCKRITEPNDQAQTRHD